MRRTSCECFECQRAHEFGCGAGEHRVDVRACVGEQTSEPRRLIGRYSAGDTKKNCAAVEGAHRRVALLRGAATTRNDAVVHAALRKLLEGSRGELLFAHGRTIARKLI